MRKKQREAAIIIQQVWRKHRAQRGALQNVILIGSNVSKFEETILAKSDAEMEPNVVFTEEEEPG